ncbi:MAG: phosphoribosylglycinamide formyltransferase [Hyphomicrobiales bacterium]|nr:phosphoribosylglycinamide formyltransferase [Hyphomicrobiales bacterium]
MSAAKKRVAVLISGRGSNMAALIEASKAPDYPAEIVLVVSNKADAAGLASASAQGIKTAVVDHRDFAHRETFDAEIDRLLKSYRIDMVCLAGFMRLLTPDFVAGWRDRMINIHPSLLPAFKGLHTHRRALEAGVKLAGCTVHFVRSDMDDGPIIIQAAVPVLDTDTEDALSARILAAEHQIYPRALELVSAGKVQVRNERVIRLDAKAAEDTGVLMCDGGV